MSETNNGADPERPAQTRPQIEVSLPTDPLELERLVRGLGRTTIVSRLPNGSPITREGLQVQALMLQNAEKYRSLRSEL